MGTDEVTTSSETQTLSLSDNGAGSDDTTQTTETSQDTVSSNVYSGGGHADSSTYATSSVDEPDSVQAFKDLQSSVDSAHYTLIFCIAVICGVVFAQNLLKGWLHA